MKSAKEVAQESDVVSVHLPLTSETKEIIDREFFGWMKPGAFLINTARGGVIPGERSATGAADRADCRRRIGRAVPGVH